MHELHQPSLRMPICKGGGNITRISRVAGHSGLEDAGGEVGADSDVILIEGFEDEARQDLAHAEARLAQPHIPPHDLRVAALLPQLCELSQKLASKPAHKAEYSSACS